MDGKLCTLDAPHGLHRDEVMRRLKLRIPGYDKGAGNAFAIFGRRHPAC